jgi:hypothetical protein
VIRSFGFTGRVLPATGRDHPVRGVLPELRGCS